MDMGVMQQLELILRIIVAGVCGILIGHERESHMKMAGIRTHVIVCMASALIMVVSKYAFNDVMNGDLGIKLDPSRIASGAVTAVGFLGAGVIFVRKQTVSGLTTAAGIWATVGIGSAVGAGLYFIGVVASVLVVLVHVVFHRKSKLVKESFSEQIVLEIGMNEDAEALIGSIFSTRKIEITNMKVKKVNDDKLEIRMIVKYPDSYELPDILRMLQEVPAIRSIEI